MSEKLNSYLKHKTSVAFIIIPPGNSEAITFGALYDGLMIEAYKRVIK
jgi:hypothetical protein